VIKAERFLTELKNIVMTKSVAIMGVRGIPAAHGGFETFAESLSLYLVQRGWSVTVYCQSYGLDSPVTYDEWREVKRVKISVSREGAAGTIVFDWRSTRHALREQHGLLLTLGYNTAAFCLLYRFMGLRNLINMDGLEWQRDKWRSHERAWLWLNERFGCWFGDHLIADHPEIKRHLATRISAKKITMIPYGARELTGAAVTPLEPLGVSPGCFIVVIARPEPENSILDVVRAFSRKPRGVKLIVLGNYLTNSHLYHRAVYEAASNEVLFPGAIYEDATTDSLRFHSRLYLHGHRVGGTNPSLVEALGAGSAVLAHDNRFNRWVAGEGAHYFTDEDSCSRALGWLLEDDDEIARMRAASRLRFQESFKLETVLEQYERLLLEWWKR
jgi:glycosyltransferase involved in cell wall biosynthesis